eukprot:6310506-Alexandrium_andersonii.AAC.1
MKDLFIVAQAAKNSFDLVYDHLPGWTQSKLTFVPDKDMPPIALRQEMWTALGVEPALVDLVACQLRLQWRE